MYLLHTDCIVTLFAFFQMFSKPNMKSRGKKLCSQGLEIRKSRIVGRKVTPSPPRSQKSREIVSRSRRLHLNRAVSTLIARYFFLVAPSPPCRESLHFGCTSSECRALGRASSSTKLHSRAEVLSLDKKSGKSGHWSQKLSQ